MNIDQTIDTEQKNNPVTEQSGTGIAQEQTPAEGKPKKRIPRAVKILIPAAVAAGLIALIAFRILNTKEKLEIDPLSTVSVGHAEIGDISIETSLIGTVMPGDVYNVIPKTSGEITDIFVKTGDLVREGDPICMIDNTKAVDAARISLDGAKVQLKNAEDGFALAKTNLDRMSVLLGSGDISQQTYETTKNGYDQAAAGLEAARLQLDGAQLQYDTQVEFSTVTAPVSGTVESTSMSLNGMASQAAPVCVISSEGENKLTFNVTDRLLSAFEPGTEITVSKQGSEYASTVTSVSKLPGAATGLYPVEAEFEGANTIPNGSSVKVSFISEKSEQTLLLDTDDIHYDGGKTYVYTLSYQDDAETADPQSTIDENNRPGTVHKVEVRTGLSNSEKTEILEGIDETTLVILSWTSQLYEGALVQVLPEG